MPQLDRVHVRESCELFIPYKAFAERQWIITGQRYYPPSTEKERRELCDLLTSETAHRAISEKRWIMAGQRCNPQTTARELCDLFTSTKFPPSTGCISLSQS